MNDLSEVRVIAAVIEQDGKYLLAKRPIHKNHGGLWEFPGGKIIDGENDFEAINRELKEELDISVKQLGKLLWQARDTRTNFLVEFYEVTFKGHPKAVEHEKIKWTSVPELGTLDLAPTDAGFVKEIILRKPLSKDGPE